VHWRPKTHPDPRNGLPPGRSALEALAAKSGFELVNVGVDGMDAFMKDKVKLYTDAAGKLGLGRK
jgi:hypothetical protein